MKSRKRKFAPDGCEHIYKNTKDGGLLFYTLSDYLVYFTMLCVEAGRMGVPLLAVTLMRDHVHEMLSVENRQLMASFEQTLNSWYAQEFNRSVGRKGQLFNHPYGSAPKREGKHIRTCFAYLANNPVERKLCRRAIEYRWNFLAYAIDPWPFSKPVVVRDASVHLRRAMQMVKARHKMQDILNYKTLERLFKPLRPDEIQQLTDYIISTYNIIDYPAAISWFGSFEKMVAAIDANTGSEYDLRETFVGKSDTVYGQIASRIMDMYPLKSIKAVLAWPPERKLALLESLFRETGIPYPQIAKFLRIKVKKSK